MKDFKRTFFIDFKRIILLEGEFSKCIYSL